MVTKTFNITGMGCAACSARVETAVSDLDSAESVNVNLLMNNMEISFDETKLSDEDIIKAIEDAGYGVSLDVKKN